MSFKDFSNREQNASLTITAVDEDGQAYVTIIPMCVSGDILKQIVTLCECENKQIVLNNLDDMDTATFWKEYNNNIQS